MIKVWLMGGLGNVLFQVLAYNKVSLEAEEVKYVDILTKSNYITRFLGWKIHERLYDDIIPLENIYSYRGVNILSSIFSAAVSKVIGKKLSHATFYTGKIKFEKTYSKNIFGYFQHKEFIENSQNELHSLCHKINSLYADKKERIVVHYRLGDSKWAKNHLYYYKYILEMVKLESETVYIVTDSVDCAKNFFSCCNNIKIINSISAIEDFKIMVSSKKLYCAPSTFSWWAAHSLDSKAEVIMPSFFINTLGIYIQEEKLKVLYRKKHV